jgi:signal transduction histidine kinase/ActR/RegA family two-component response regulator
MKIDSLFEKFQLSFQAKVIIPVVALFALFFAIIVVLVNGRITEQFEEESRQTLFTAEGVFRNSIDIRMRNLLLRYQTVANEPRFKAVAQLADSKTMSVQLLELLHEIGSNTKTMVFTTPDNQLLASAQQNANINVSEFLRRSRSTVDEAAQGRPAADTIVVGRYLLNTISVPVTVNDMFVGVLTIGESIGLTAAEELKSLTRTEIVLIASKQVVLSTLRNSRLDQGFLDSFAPQIAERGSHLTKPVAVGAEHYLSLAGAFPSSNSSVGFLLLSSYEKALQRKQEVQRTLTLISLAGILFSSVLLWILIRQITKPLRHLRDSAEAVGRGDFSQLVSVASDDELGELAGVFNQMIANLNKSRADVHQAMQTLKDTQAQLIQTEKLSAMGKFVAGIAHELNNPLTGVIGFSEMLQESGISERQQTFLNRITGSAERCRKIVHNLLSFSRRYKPERKWVYIQEVVESALEILKYELTSSNVEVTVDIPHDMPVMLMDPHQIQQVFLNIIMNAIQATEQRVDARSLMISAQVTKDKLRIRFEDNGTGIAKEDLTNVFNPFFTTKPVGIGTGLGLSLSYGIVQEHGGTILAESKSDHGAAFTVELPIVREVPEVQVADGFVKREPAIASKDPGKKILVIDDEESILELIREALGTRGYHVDTAVDGNAALAFAGKNYYDLVICDWIIPGTSGQKIYEQFRELKPKIAERFIFLTGDILSNKAEQFLATEAKLCIHKPFSVDEFRATIEKALNSP